MDMDIVTQLSIIAQDAHNQVQVALMYVACAALAVSILTLFAVKVLVPSWEQIRKYFSLPRIQQVMVGVFVCGLVYYGSTKQAWHVSYDGGIKAGTQENVVTNNLVNIFWQKDTSGGIIVPDSATVYIDYRLIVETNGEWSVLGQTTVGAGHYTTMFPNATNYNYNVWAYYIPPEPVHTNGVWTYKTLKDRAGANAIPLRARIEVNGKAISTPKQKRKDEE